MRAFISDIAYLLRTKWSFRLAIVYLALLTGLVLLLPLLPLPFSPNELNLQHAFQKPFTNPTYILGTDQLGRDVLSNLLWGARNGLFIAVPVMLLSAVLGTAVGAVAGYFGNSKWKLTYAQVLLILVTIPIVCYYLIHLPMQVVLYSLPGKVAGMAIVAGLALSAILWLIIKPLLNNLMRLRQTIAIPVDGIALRLIELLTSIPRLILLISVAAFAGPSLWLLSVILICTFWTGTARLARAEMLRIVQLPYIEAAISTGMKHRRVILKEALPNLLTPVIVAFVFGVASLLAVESTLSFLGIGLPATHASWGRTISSIRLNLSAWWLVALPGGFLALTVLALQTCSYHLIRLSQQK
ncbi:ABC transporter permease [Pontibacter sp. Tf4]|uniref:ABC transporter permease n=1 Tax=Pontibacter sp. Tf4 TaxID=2761620 RepID=UPI0016271F74|nr:ABC transporter permease [Pontibacter sp. Tf4]MBB6611976.1 ABC transporter permease [Pontibacter sp. Tf4]